MFLCRLMVGVGETEREPVRYAAKDWKVLFRSVPLRY
jgi:hypothetical protein